MTLPSYTRGEWEDIGDGVRLRRVFESESLCAVEYEHPPVAGCDGSASYIPVGPPGSFIAEHHWTLLVREPLTLSPSLLCQLCKHHGFIERGRWVPA